MLDLVIISHVMYESWLAGGGGGWMTVFIGRSMTLDNVEQYVSAGDVNNWHKNVFRIIEECLWSTAAVSLTNYYVAIIIVCHFGRLESLCSAAVCLSVS